jgi:hypothetical protein
MTYASLSGWPTPDRLHDHRVSLAGVEVTLP